MAKNKILFTGYYGFKNLGDDMFGLVSTWAAKEFWSGNNIKILSRSGAVDKNVNVVKALDYRFKFKGQTFLASFFETLISKYVVLAGGSILHSKPSLISARWLTYFLAKYKMKNVGAIGVSLGPFKSDKDYEYIKSVLNNFKFLALRDSRSYEIANEMKLSITPVLASDLAFLLPQLSNNKSFIVEKERKVLGVSLCHYERYSGRGIDNEKRREKAIFQTLDKLNKDTDVSFRFFIINGNKLRGDKKITETIIRKLDIDKERFEIVQYTPDTLSMYTKIAECDVMFSTRLHGAIFAAASNVPSILVEYHDKCTDYLSSIEVNKKWQIGDMKETPFDVFSMINELLNDKVDNFYPNRNQLIYLAEQNFTNTNIIKEFV